MSDERTPLPRPFQLRRFDAVGSTSDEVKQLARAGAAEGMIVTAEVQNAGRGRRGRTWVSPRGNLYMSILLRPHCRAATAAQLGFVAALGLSGALAELAPGIDFACKWPNDVLANGKKLAGILLETEMVAGDVPDFVVIGIGVNLASSPRDVAYPTSSLAEEGCAAVAPLTALAAVMRHFAPWHECWRDGGFAPIRTAWIDRAIGFGEPIRVRLERDTLDGRFADLDADGALLLDLPGGRRRIAAGEVFPVHV
jgi:BirA family transcriptional regulator, biotin operon repressor / biotin---[acetyl-CoA-carboxylase] ligase